MDSSASKLGSGEIHPHVLASPPSTVKTYGFAIAIIVGIGGLAIGAAGVAGYFQVGALRNMAQVDAIIMMAAGGGGGAILLIVGVMGSIKNRQSGSQQPLNDLPHDLPPGPEQGRLMHTPDELEKKPEAEQKEDTKVEEETPSATEIHEVAKKLDEIALESDTQGGVGTEPEQKRGVEVSDDSPLTTEIEWRKEDVDTHGGLVYGPKTWGTWKVKILDEVIPVQPPVDLSKGDKILLYIPKEIEVNGERKLFTLMVLQEICGVPGFRILTKRIIKKFGSKTADEFGDKTAHGWVLIDKKVLPESFNRDYESQKKMVEEKGCRMPSVLEASVLNFMVFAFTGDRLYQVNEYTRCSEVAKVKSKSYPVVVGGFNAEGLHVCGNSSSAKSYCGVACVRSNFKPEKEDIATHGALVEEPEAEKKEHVKFLEAIPLAPEKVDWSNFGLVCGHEAWKSWNVEIVEKVPSLPKIDWSMKENKDKVLLYIPHKIRFKGGEEKVLTLTGFKEICGVAFQEINHIPPFRIFEKTVEAKCGSSTAPGWVLIDKYVIPGSRGKGYEEQIMMVKNRGCKMPRILEVAVLNLMVFTFTKKRLYGGKVVAASAEPFTFTRCVEFAECERGPAGEEYPIMVGGFISEGLQVSVCTPEYDKTAEDYGVAGVKRFP